MYVLAGKRKNEFRLSKSTFTDRYSRFREMLVERRKVQGLTQVELAERLRKPQSFVSKIENGERRIDIVEFHEVLMAMGIDPLKFAQQLFKEFAK